MARESDRDREWMREAQVLARVRAIASASRGPSPQRLVVAGVIGMVVLITFFLTGTVTAVHFIDEASIASESERAAIALGREFGDGPVDLAAVDRLGHDYSLLDARVTGPETLRSGEVSVPLPSGDTNAVLAWTPRRFASEAFDTIAPMRLGIAAVFVSGIAFILFRLQKLALELERRRELAHELASRDALTGLRNRLTFDQELRDAFAAPEPKPLALLYLDLDDFKVINDTLGHAAGDELLRLVGDRLSAAVRASDTLARLGGDEFALICRDGLGPDELAVVARRLRDALTAPFTLEGVPVTIGVSIGIAAAPDSARGANDLVRAADSALYRAKDLGGSSYAFADPLVPHPMAQPLVAA